MNRFKIHFPLLASIVVTISCLIGVGFWFNKNTNQLIEKYIYGSLKDNCSSLAATFDNRIDDKLKLLEDISHYFEDIDMNNFAQIKKVMTSMKAMTSFKLYGICDRKGHSITYRGDDFYSNGIRYFEEAMKGHSYIYKNTSSVGEFGDVILISVPVKKNGEVLGVVFGIFTRDEFNEIINGLNSNPNSASILVMSDGTILARSKTPHLITDRIVNFFDIGTSWGLKGEGSLSSIKDYFDNNESAIIPYSSGTKKRLAIISPVGDHDWYFAVITPQTVITDLSTTLSNQVIIIEIVLSMAFLMLLISILFLHNNNVIINRTNEKFKMATKQNQTVVFDYNFSKKEMEFSGDTEFITGEQIDVLSVKKVADIMRLVHKEDSSFVKELFELTLNDIESINREIRLKCFDGNYYWFKMIGTVIRDENNHPRHLVGNFLNVDDAINKEQMLKQKAELDPLTSLLNKGAFQEKIEQVLSDSNPFDLYAFYIIDLDNFKKINDSMGHIVGDKVLSDTAKKLCTIFSESDFVGRIGGDEFAAFLKLSADGKKYADKIISGKAKAICSHLNEKYSNGTVEVEVSASVGIAFYPLHGTKYEDLYKNADSVLYDSKKDGKNRFTIYNETISTTI